MTQFEKKSSSANRPHHYRGSSPQITTNGGEIEWRNPRNEAFKTTKSHTVASFTNVGALWLPAVGELFRVKRIESKEVGQLASGVDLGLEKRLRLTQNRGRVQFLSVLPSA